MKHSKKQNDRLSPLQREILHFGLPGVVILLIGAAVYFWVRPLLTAPDVDAIEPKVSTRLDVDFSDPNAYSVLRSELWEAEGLSAAQVSRLHSDALRYYGYWSEGRERVLFDGYSHLHLPWRIHCVEANEWVEVTASARPILDPVERVDPEALRILARVLSVHQSVFFDQSPDTQAMVSASHWQGTESLRAELGIFADEAVCHVHVDPISRRYLGAEIIDPTGMAYQFAFSDYQAHGPRKVPYLVNVSVNGIDTLEIRLSQLERY